MTRNDHPADHGLEPADHLEIMTRWLRHIAHLERDVFMLSHMDRDQAAYAAMMLDGLLIDLRETLGLLAYYNGRPHARYSDEFPPSYDQKRVVQGVACEAETDARWLVETLTARWGIQKWEGDK